ncbi:MAG: ATP-binding protein [Patescibacteria group bacterium]|nr:ATP-binding protein [Patescibacteria group bacterium]
MDISEIIKTLDKWNFWNQKIDTGIRRQFYLDELNRYLKMSEIVALTGVRRSGKSTIILQIIEDLIQNKKVNPKNTLYLNFEEPSFGGSLELKLLIKIFDAYLEFYNPKGKVYLFLDEVQLVKNWEKFVVSLYDRKANIKIFVTGSSSKLLQSEISTLLSGRYISKIVYPLSFMEFLDFKKIGYKPLLKTPKLYNQLREYLEFGGFPKIVLEKNKHNKRILLAEYFNSIVERDIILRHQIKNIKDVKEIISFVFAKVSKQTSTYKLEKNFDISSQNIRRYFEYFDEAFLLQFVSFFSYSVKKQIYNPQKIFSIDTGLRNAVSFKFSEDIGKLLENTVFMEFLRKKEQAYYWENGTEIDFLIRKGYQVSELFNVCYSLEDKQTLNREIKSLEKGMAEFKKSKAKATLIYWEGALIKHPKIKFINILDFLLN